uniref:(northern house mosquito) hypothetical protein n=1 Tax=Culex pipiens TaxID=7175 RepID=A0A8D8FNE0_CULPI
MPVGVPVLRQLVPPDVKVEKVALIELDVPLEGGVLLAATVRVAEVGFKLEDSGNSAHEHQLKVCKFVIAVDANLPNGTKLVRVLLVVGVLQIRDRIVINVIIEAIAITFQPLRSTCPFVEQSLLNLNFSFEIRRTDCVPEAQVESSRRQRSLVQKVRHAHVCIVTNPVPNQKRQRSNVLQLQQNLVEPFLAVQQLHKRAQLLLPTLPDLNPQPPLEAQLVHDMFRTDPRQPTPVDVPQRKGSLNRSRHPQNRLRPTHPNVSRFSPMAIDRHRSRRSHNQPGTPRTNVQVGQIRAQLVHPVRSDVETAQLDQHARGQRPLALGAPVPALTDPVLDAPEAEQFRAVRADVHVNRRMVPAERAGQTRNQLVQDLLAGYCRSHVYNYYSFVKNYSS